MKRGVLPLNSLRALESTLRLGQMTLAAEELGVTYGAVSRHIRRLEEMLGAKLFEGPRNRLIPTQVSKRLQPALGVAFDSIEAAVGHEVRLRRRTLDLCCLGMFARRWLIGLLPEFQRRHPGIDIRLTTTETPEAAVPRSGVTITVGPKPWHADAIPLFPEQLGPVLHPSLLADPLEPAGLACLPYLHTKASPDVWPDWCRARGLQATGEGRDFETLPTVIEGAQAGLGVAIAPAIVVEPEIRAGQLAAPLGFEPSGRTYLALAAPAAGEEADNFICWLSEHAARRRRAMEAEEVPIAAIHRRA